MFKTIQFPSSALKSGKASLIVGREDSHRVVAYNSLIQIEKTHEKVTLYFRDEHGRICRYKDGGLATGTNYCPENLESGELYWEGYRKEDSSSANDTKPNNITLFGDLWRRIAS